MVTGADIAERARQLIGVQWQHHGRNVHGVDCVGVVLLSMQQAGVEQLPAVPARYGVHPGPELLATVESCCARVSDKSIELPGALALFEFDRHPYPRHAGILTGSGLVHCNAILRRVVHHGLRAQWARWLHSVWMLPGVEYR